MSNPTGSALVAAGFLNPGERTMARGRKKKAPVERTIKITASDFKKAVEEASRLKEQSSSYSGFHGQHVKNFTERSGFSRQAFAVISKMDRLGDDLKRQSLMDEIVMGFELMGWNDQGTLFDRVKTRIGNDVEPDGEDEEPDDSPRFLRDAMPLDGAEKAFTDNGKPENGWAAATREVQGETEKAARARSKKTDPLADLAGGPDHPPVH